MFIGMDWGLPDKTQVDCFIINVWSTIVPLSTIAIFPDDVIDVWIKILVVNVLLFYITMTWSMCVLSYGMKYYLFVNPFKPAGRICFCVLRVFLCFLCCFVHVVLCYVFSCVLRVVFSVLCCVIIFFCVTFCFCLLSVVLCVLYVVVVFYVLFLW